MSSPLHFYFNLKSLMWAMQLTGKGFVLDFGSGHWKSAARIAAHGHVSALHLDELFEQLLLRYLKGRPIHQTLIGLLQLSLTLHNFNLNAMDHSVSTYHFTNPHLPILHSCLPCHFDKYVASWFEI
ncbi:uncharacterized protein SPPG_09195 [Spizellomyces punctatus DAOM BR117]|uniref:Uncharacterized protein n=1 Tax=Spizellomyces punctatus (strain DAOM BR117) TaxID=645134 RepID=A0A0L0HGU9_SPIPD|nr:uncharacterized protein SPPG_09195 [Spizellomyces punctatus DAOM BR117]KND00085.1 hypothetical protein SPPG_09195 [Spizellomyces punctatus DAOM BR117]|eukprot:XP_016608124.1 hypothetical protein SPPG_09195 [Spizellomyces punctatus DAOM BR117]